jgi:uncharacterized protein
MDLIITHAKCPDGWCAAFIAKKRYPEAEIMPLDHGSPVPFDAVRGKNVLVVDFSWPNRQDNIELHRIAKSFHIYDHHKTAQEKLEGLDFVTFDMKRSGAGLAWDYLISSYPSVYNPLALDIKVPRPWYVSYTEDRDLWNWALPGSKAVNAYLMSLPQTIEAWSALDILKVEYAEQIGVGILRHVDRYVQEAAAEAQLGQWYMSGAPEYPSCFEYYTAAVVNAPYMNCSEVGHVLAQKADVGMTWFERADGQIQFSLRSVGDIDVSRIVKKFGGGGHTHAAGFRMPLVQGRELIDSILGRSMTQEQINKRLDAMSSPGFIYPGPRC